MFAPEFDFHRASSVAEAIQLLSANDGAKLVAGGQSLIPLLKLRFSRPTALIDIGGITDLKTISVENGTVRIADIARRNVQHAMSGERRRDHQIRHSSVERPQLVP